MLRSAVILCLLVACLTQAAYLDKKAENEEWPSFFDNLNKREEGGQQGQEEWDGRELSPELLNSGLAASKGNAVNLEKQVEGLIGKVVRAKTKEDWYPVMTDMAKLMKGSYEILGHTLKGVVYASIKMWTGQHGFEPVSRCGSLAKVTDSLDKFGKEGHLEQIHYALIKDLICFTNLFKETYNMKLRTADCSKPSEDDVISLIADVSRDLFRLHNDKKRFAIAVGKVTSFYDKELHEHFLDELQAPDKKFVRGLLQALKSAAALEDQ